MATCDPAARLARWQLMAFVPTVQVPSGQLALSTRRPSENVTFRATLDAASVDRFSTVGRTVTALSTVTDAVAALRISRSVAGLTMTGKATLLLVRSVSASAATEACSGASGALWWS